MRISVHWICNRRLLSLLCVHVCVVALPNRAKWKLSPFVSGRCLMRIFWMRWKPHNLVVRWFLKGTVCGVTMRKNDQITFHMRIIPLVRCFFLFLNLSLNLWCFCFFCLLVCRCCNCRFFWLYKYISVWCIDGESFFLGIEWTIESKGINI